MADILCVLRGAGDLATGVAWRLTRSGATVIATELPAPKTVRRTVALSQAVHDGTTDVEGMVGRLAPTPAEAIELARVDPHNTVGLVVSPTLPDVAAEVIVDARMAKRNIDTTIHDAPLVIGLGPGFTAGVDCHAVVETMRGHHLGRVLWRGTAAADTGAPGLIAGYGTERVVRAASAGSVGWQIEIGDTVAAGETIGAIDGEPIRATLDGVVRGLILDGTSVEPGLKIGDIDPRADRSACYEISDKALGIGGGVAEAVFWWATRSR